MARKFASYAILLLAISTIAMTAPVANGPVINGGPVVHENAGPEAQEASGPTVHDNSKLRKGRGYDGDWLYSRDAPRPELNIDVTTLRIPAPLNVHPRTAEAEAKPAGKRGHDGDWLYSRGNERVAAGPKAN